MAFNRYKEMVKWFVISIQLSEKFEFAELPFIPRGSVAFAQLGENIGHEKCDLRPVLVISNDQINRTSSNIVIAVLTDASNKKDSTGRTKLLFSQYELFKNDFPFLTFDSIIQFEDIKSISKVRIGKPIGMLTSSQMAVFENRIKSTLGL
jgi:mRNA interferase MazF